MKQVLCKGAWGRFYLPHKHTLPVVGGKGGFAAHYRQKRRFLEGPGTLWVPLQTARLRKSYERKNYTCRACIATFFSL